MVSVWLNKYQDFACWCFIVASGFFFFTLQIFHTHWKKSTLSWQHRIIFVLLGENYILDQFPEEMERKFNFFGIKIFLKPL